MGKSAVFTRIDCLDLGKSRAPLVEANIEEPADIGDRFEGLWQAAMHTVLHCDCRSHTMTCRGRNDH